MKIISIRFDQEKYHRTFKYSISEKYLKSFKRSRISFEGRLIAIKKCGRPHITCRNSVTFVLNQHLPYLERWDIVTDADR